MYKVPLLILLFYYSLASSAQNGVVLDALSKKGIAFATVYGTYTHKGAYTTDDGKFATSLSKKDSLEVTCIGYEKLTKAWYPGHFDTIFLRPLVIELSEVKLLSIDKSKFNQETLGFAGKKSNTLFGGSTGLEFAVFIENKDRCSDCLISKLNYQIKKSGWDSAVAIRLHLFESASDGSPGRELLDSNYFVILAGVINGIVSYDVSDFKIKLPLNGIFIGLEWLGTYTNSNTVLFNSAVEPMIALNNKADELFSFERIARGRWKKGDNETLFASRGSANADRLKKIWNASFGIGILKPKKKSPKE
jgi:hypothetical protein